MINQNRPFFVSARTFAKFALAVCSTIALSTVADADTIALNGGIILSSGAYTVAESAGSVTLTVERSGGTTGAVSVSYKTQNGSATAGGAYTAASGTLTWANGDGSNKSITIPVLNTSTTGTKDFYIVLDAVGSTLLGEHRSATIDIVSSTTPAAPSTTKSIKEWVSCNESVDETTQFKAALAAAANNAFTLVIDCPVRFHTGYSGGTPVSVPNGVTMSFSGSGELLTAGTGLTIANLSEVTFIDFNLVLL